MRATRYLRRACAPRDGAAARERGLCSVDYVPGKEALIGCDTVCTHTGVAYGMACPFKRKHATCFKKKWERTSRCERRGQSAEPEAERGEGRRLALSDVALSACEYGFMQYVKATKRGPYSVERRNGRATRPCTESMTERLTSWRLSSYQWRWRLARGVPLVRQRDSRRADRASAIIRTLAGSDSRNESHELGWGAEALYWRTRPGFGPPAAATWRQGTQNETRASS